jgi:mRNA-degrading endonuclease RelE of RelBE toxin-antitoxin system
LLLQHAADAAWNRQLDAAQVLLDLTHTPAEPLQIWARVALAQDPTAAADLVEQSLADNLDQLPIEAAYALLRSRWPALGIWISRALLPWLEPEDAEPLIAELQDTRERLGAGPWDPVEELLYTLQHGHDPQTAQRLEQAQARIRSNETRLIGTTAELRALREALAAKQAPHTPEPASPRSAPQHDPAAVALEARIQTLKGELKRRHDERNALRRELRAVHQAAARQESQDEANPETQAEVEEAGPDAASTEGRLRLPEFSQRFSEALQRVPSHTARAAVEKLCAIAVGREGATVGTRRLRGKEDLWRARIGRSYRMLFTLDDEAVLAIDLVHRQELETRIKQLD